MDNSHNSQHQHHHPHDIEGAQHAGTAAARGVPLRTRSFNTTIPAASNTTKEPHHRTSTIAMIPVETQLEKNISTGSSAGAAQQQQAAAVKIVAPAPRSRGLPLHKQQNLQQDDARLLHPVLLKVPLQLRFICNGLLSSVLFMVAYNMSVVYIPTVAPSTLYSVVYFIFIPLGHAMVSLLVFGWPERYIPSLMSNLPIGLTAMAIGGALTAYLDRIEFNDWIEEYIRDNLQFSRMPPRARHNEEEGEEHQQPSEFYTSLAVLVVTSIWTYVLSVYINSPPAKSDKKEL